MSARFLESPLFSGIAVFTACTVQTLCDVHSDPEEIYRRFMWTSNPRYLRLDDRIRDMMRENFGGSNFQFLFPSMINHNFIINFMIKS